MLKVKPAIVPTPTLAAIQSADPEAIASAIAALETMEARAAVTLPLSDLEVSASGYYAWRGRPESASAAANRALLGDIRRIHAQHRGRYGAPRIHAALRAEGRPVGRGRIERLMRRHGIRATTPRRRVSPPQPRQKPPPPPRAAG